MFSSKRVVADNEASVRTIREEIRRLERGAEENLAAAARLESEATMLEHQAARWRIFQIIFYLCFSTF